jgi:putative flippase GtrA
MTKDARLIEETKNLIRQFIRFGAIGLLNTGLHIGLYLLFMTLIPPTIAYFLASSLAMFVAVYLNLKYTFKKRATPRKITMFVCVYVLSMYIGGGIILPMFVELSLSPQLAGFLAICVTVITNFLGLKAAAKWA